MVPVSNLIEAFAVVRNGIPRMKGLFSFSLKSIITKSTGSLIVSTGKVVVPTGRYVVPVGKVIIIVSTGRLSLVPTGKVLSPGRVK
ncbi:hypothetical protein Tco_0586230, partial [Tanacetum coccineum]